MSNGRNAPPARYWIGTASTDKNCFSPWWPLPEGIVYCSGQREIGEGGFQHYQFYVILKSAQRLSWLSTRYPGVHFEATRSSAAEAYCSKEATGVPGSQFCLGTKPFRRNSKTDWDKVRQDAESGSFGEIPSDVFVRHYGSLRRIAADCARPVALERSCTVLWGRSGVGKSRRAWEEAGDEAYCKDPLTKWWCGYRGQTNVIVDEFRGIINISHLLRWLDRYPVLVETKGSSQPLLASKFWITSNLHPREWYPDLDSATYEALERRMKIIHMVNFE